MSQTDGDLVVDANEGTSTGITRLLQSWSSGDAAAAERLLPVVYGELRRRAAAQLLSERRSHTLQPTALVHEAFLRLQDQRSEWQNRTHFFATASRLMRRILVDHARRRLAAKRRAGRNAHVPIAGEVTVASPARYLVRLDDALEDLARLDQRQARIVELCYFGGFTEEEISEALAISRSTVARELRSARAFLHRQLTWRDPREPL